MNTLIFFYRFECRLGLSTFSDERKIFQGNLDSELLGATEVGIFKQILKWSPPRINFLVARCGW